ncbi:conserved Plasmodium protein, unknown function [Plasmodium berghei]|uniref:Arabinogalactan protein n=2 Tax=Plasmodium berghei TaxID=5821 RepID=A0A509ALA7_PLABA|nr:conserved protein, unknown function [Plasmodium berghei ANKA]CXI69874.1 conserved Plasmodium protein, unknown function [Plasmodium berghei]SCM24254.1 conserved Plasmodium protein, unknown function [Plasmodium berghei]SCN27036.1 conserved Plasmodium protein, unknown function [Plasmodium berghei]SCO61481.1 conserved Plasmodium protein, unknown function [Plasmodium berghei]SCO63459.1 conserved Plasmodium protein, unknown function [Plasmodium berghei]|eukprot:XP_034422653.1 conserved protein, unknown function [Plasmodium berghei ANKA]
MALNPTTIRGQEYLFPSNKESEFIYLRREDVKLKLYLPDRTIKEDGTIFLTSIRLVFIKNEKSKTNINFTGADFPLTLIDNVNFEQPIFGLNYLSGVVRPLVDHPNSLSSPCKWNIIFLNGQCSNFLNYFFKAYEAAKKNKTLGSLSEFNDHFFSSNNAYIDPNDPTFIYINEPISESMNNSSQNHYVNNQNNNEEIPVYKIPYLPQNNNMMPYGQQFYMGDQYFNNNYRSNSEHQYGNYNIHTQNNMQNYNTQSPYENQNNNYASNYNQHDNKTVYPPNINQNNNNTRQSVMSHYTQYNNETLSYEERIKRNMYSQDINESNNSNNPTSGNQHDDQTIFDQRNIPMNYSQNMQSENKKNN